MEQDKKDTIQLKLTETFLKIGTTEGLDELFEGKIGTVGVMVYDKETDIGLVAFSVDRSPKVGVERGAEVLLSLAQRLVTASAMAVERGKSN